jgi:hypothetical protein
MIYVRSFSCGLLAVVLLVLLSGLVNFMRRVLIYLVTKPPGEFQMVWDLTAVRESRALWVLIFLVFAAGFFWEFQTLSN